MKILITTLTIILIGCKNNESPSNSKVLEPVEVSGVVTYLFNRNFGDRRDIGSEVYLAMQSSAPECNTKSIDSFLQGTFIRNICLSYKSLKIKVPVDVSNDASKYNVMDTANYYALLRRAIHNKFQITLSRDVIKTVVDATGKFSVKLSPGDYFMIIESKQRYPAFYFQTVP